MRSTSVCTGDSSSAALWHERFEQTREAIARLINVKAREVAFIKNTSEGIALTANGLRWQPGDNVVLLSRDFPSNCYPWVRLQRLGLELCRSKDVLFFVDAIQQVGALRLDAADCGASTVACGSHKWMMGPRGVGFF